MLPIHKRAVGFVLEARRESSKLLKEVAELLKQKDFLGAADVGRKSELFKKKAEALQVIFIELFRSDSFGQWSTEEQFIAACNDLEMDGAVFEVIHVDPEGSGMDYFGHLGSKVYKAKRCCKNCTCIFASFKQGDVDPQIGPFIRGELKPLNEAAEKIQAEIEKDYPGQ